MKLAGPYCICTNDDVKFPAHIYSTLTTSSLVPSRLVHYSTTDHFAPLGFLSDGRVTPELVL